MEERTAELMADEAARAAMQASEFDHDFLAAHLTDERRKSSLLGEIREAIFGAQDGLVSTLAVVSTVAGATSERYPVLVAGIASGLAGIFSMAAGEYIGSKSQREIFDAQIVEEREEVHQRPGEAEAEMAYMFEEDGLPHEQALEWRASWPSIRTCCSRRWSRRSSGSRSRMAAARRCRGRSSWARPSASAPFHRSCRTCSSTSEIAVLVSVAATLAVLFAIGVVKSRWTHRSWWASGLEILFVGAVAGIAGYFFGNVLPIILGAPEAA